MTRKPLTNKTGDVRPLNAEDFAQMRRLKDVHPEIVAALKRMRGRPKLDRPKRQWTLRLDAAVVDAIKASGQGYMARVERVLRDAVTKGQL